MFVANDCPALGESRVAFKPGSTFLKETIFKNSAAPLFKVVGLRD